MRWLWSYPSRTVNMHMIHMFVIKMISITWYFFFIQHETTAHSFMKDVKSETALKGSGILFYDQHTCRQTPSLHIVWKWLDDVVGWVGSKMCMTLWLFLSSTTKPVPILYFLFLCMRCSGCVNFICFWWRSRCIFLLVRMELYGRRKFLWSYRKNANVIYVFRYVST